MAARRPNSSSSSPRRPGRARKDTRLASRVKTKPRARKTTTGKRKSKQATEQELEALTPPPRVLRLDLVLLAVVLVFVMLGWHFFPMETLGEKTAEANHLPVPAEMNPVAEQASEHFASGNLEGAAQCYEDIILRHPDNLFAWSNLGVVRYQQQEYEEASVALEKAVRLNPDDAFSQSMLGIVYYHMGRRDSAVEALQRSVELAPNDPMTLNYLGMTLSQSGKRAVAERLLRRAVELVPHYGDAHYNLAVALLLKDEPEPANANRHYRRALELGVPKSLTFEELLTGLRQPQQQAANTLR